MNLITVSASNTGTLICLKSLAIVFLPEYGLPVSATSIIEYKYSKHFDKNQIEYIT
jgi:hypothetical protein